MEDITPVKIRQQLTQRARANYESALSEAHSVRQRTIAEAYENRKETLLMSQQLLIQAKNRLNEARDSVEKRFRMDEYLKIRQNQESLIAGANRTVRITPTLAMETEKRRIASAREELQWALSQAAEVEKNAYNQAREEKKRKIKLAQLVKEEARRGRQSARTSNIGAQTMARKRAEVEQTAKLAVENMRLDKAHSEKRLNKEARNQQQADEKAKTMAERQARETREKERIEKARLTQKEAKEELKRRKAEAKTWDKDRTRIKGQESQIKSTTVGVTTGKPQAATLVNNPLPEHLRNEGTPGIQEVGRFTTEAKAVETDLGVSEPVFAASAGLNLYDTPSDSVKLPDAEAANARDKSTKSGSGLQQGLIKLVISAAEEVISMKELEKSLRTWPDIKLVYVGCDGASTAIIVSIPNAVPLVDRLRELPVIKEVIGKGNEIKLILKSGK